MGSSTAALAAAASLVTAGLVAAQQEPCDGVAQFYLPEELPRVHEIDLRMACARRLCTPRDAGYHGSMHELVDNQWNRNFGELPVEIVLNGVSHPGGKIQVHGGTPQRAGLGGGKGTDCAIYGKDPSARPTPTMPSCKPGFRLNFGKHHPINSSVPLWSYPRHLQSCAYPDKFTLRNEYGDPSTMVRNKLSNDLSNKVSQAALRVEYARIMLNGEFFGLYTLEERVDKDFLKCRDLPHHDPGTALYKAYPDKSIGYGSGIATAWQDCPGDAVECNIGFEMKIPSCDGCTGEMFSDTEPGSCSARGPSIDNMDSEGVPRSDPSCLSRWQSSSPRYQDPLFPDCPRNCSAPTALAELMGAVNRPGTTLPQLATTLNLTSYMLWQIQTTFTMADDSGWHNYYLYRPRAGAPWAVINYDADNSIGQSAWHGWQRQIFGGTSPSGCSCDVVATLDDAAFSPWLAYFSTVKPANPLLRLAGLATPPKGFPSTFSFAASVVFMLLSCFVECRHWPEHRRKHSVVVVPLAPVSPLAMIVTAPPNATAGMQINVDTADNRTLSVVVPEGITGGQQFRVELPSLEQLSPPPAPEFILPPGLLWSECWPPSPSQCEAGCPVWKFPRPVAHESNARSSQALLSAVDGGTDTLLNPVAAGTDTEYITDDLVDDSPPAGTAAQLQVHAQAAHQWVLAKTYQFPTRAAFIFELFSLVLAYRNNQFNACLGCYANAMLGNMCCCGPLARAWNGRRTKGCCVNADGTPVLSCFCLIVTIVVYVLGGSVAAFAQPAQADCAWACELTGFDFRNVIGGGLWWSGLHEQAMEPVLQKLALPQYYGLYADFLAADFSQSCALNNAIDQLVGPTGEIHEKLMEDKEFWQSIHDGSATVQIDGEVGQMRGWVTAKGVQIRSSLAARCGMSDEACITGDTCLAKQCAATGTSCVQGSVSAACETVEPDGCGCASGTGWSSTLMRCAPRASTSASEAGKCGARPAGGG